MSNKINNCLKRLVLCTALILPSLQVSAQVIEEVEQSFSISKQSDFSLNNINGTVTINSWQENSVKILAKITAQTQTSSDDVIIKMTQSGPKVTVSTDYKEKGYRQHKQAAKVDYQVWLPAETNLTDIELINGSLVIKDISGKVAAQVVNGSINATGLRGDSDVSSVNGSVNVWYHQYAHAIENIAVETVNGSIKLYLPENINADITADTMHGSINTTFGLTANKNGFLGLNLRGKIGNGGGQINLDSVNGSIELLKSE